MDFKNLIIVARSVFLLAIILETFFGILFVILHNFLPHLFLNMENVNQAIENKEVIIIAQYLGVM